MSFRYDLNGRTALVTGASSGIGEQLARTLAACGANVVMAARRINRIEALATEIRNAGGSAQPVELDVSDIASIAAAYDSAESTFGIVDTIIANAGVTEPGRSTDIDPDALTRVFDTNLKGLYLSVREGARRLINSGSRDNEQGRIILIGSITAEMTNQGDAAYAASKAAVAHLGRQFAREWVRQGINVNTVQPGYIKTELTGGWFDSEGGRDQINSWHRRRIMSIDALDDMIAFLASERSRYITGATITIDDGQSL